MIGIELEPSRSGEIEKKKRLKNSILSRSLQRLNLYEPEECALCRNTPYTLPYFIYMGNNTKTSCYRDYVQIRYK